MSAGGDLSLIRSLLRIVRSTEFAFEDLMTQILSIQSSDVNLVDVSGDARSEGYWRTSTLISCRPRTGEKYLIWGNRPPSEHRLCNMYLVHALVFPPLMAPHYLWHTKQLG